MDIQEVGWGYGMYVPQNMDKWLVVVKTVMNHRVNLWTS